MGETKLPVITPDIKETVLNRIADGETIQSICNDLEIGVRTLNYLMVKDTLFAKEVASSRAIAAHKAVDSLQSIYDDAETMTAVQRARGQSDNIKWLASKLAPDVYGDRIQVDHKHTIDLTKVLEAASGRLISHLNSEILIDVTPQLDKPIKSDT